MFLSLSESLSENLCVGHNLVPRDRAGDFEPQLGCPSESSSGQLIN